LNDIWIEKDEILETMAQSHSTMTDKNKSVEINTTS